MTPITINLLAEEQLAQQASARDPLKTAIAAGAIAIATAAGAGSVLSMLASQKRTELALWQAKWQQLAEQHQNRATDKLQTIRALATDILALHQSRRLLAPQLALVKDLVPDSIQLTRLNLAVAIETAGSAEPGADDSPTGTAKPAARARIVERLLLQLQGRATGSPPEIAVDRYMQTLRTDPAFSEQIEQVQLRSIARATAPTDNAAAGLPVASFVIDCQYKPRP
jgi:hypothetical protein